MSTNHYPIEIPTLVPITVEPTPVELTTQELPSDPAPASVCIFDKYGKPLEAKRVDVSTRDGRKTLYDMTTDACFDELSAVVWPEGGKSPLLPAMELLRRMVARYNLGHIQDNQFVASWIKDAKTILLDFSDITELLNFVEPSSEKQHEETGFDDE